MPSFDSILWVYFNPDKEDLVCPIYLLVLSPPTYKLHPKGPLEVDDIPYGGIIVYVPIIMLGFLSTMVSKLIIG